MTLPNYKDIVELLKKGSTLEAQEKIMELRESALELQEQNVTLRKRVGDLEAELARLTEMEFREGAYWRNYGTDDVNGPHCQPCLDGNGKLVRLHDEVSRKGSRSWRCHVCGFYKRHLPLEHESDFSTT